MTGTYTEITITAPDSAEAGSTVNVTVTIKNITEYTVYVIPVLDINGSITEGSYETITPGESFSWYFGFTMPTTNTTLIVSSWLETYNVEWQQDYSVQHTVLATGAGVSIGIDLGSMMSMMIVVMMMSMMSKMMKGV